MEHEGDSDINSSWTTWNGSQKRDKGIARFLRHMKNQDHPHYIISKIGQNTEKNPRVRRRLAISQIPVKNLTKSEMILVMTIVQEVLIWPYKQMVYA